jgi:DNA invertase Pin-like site-specific DNA recombinase
MEYQATANAAYAALHGFEIIRTYSDPGVSGLDLARRKGLQQLLADVIGGADYATVLVYDVSRWGRFQDPDEGAHYEFLCRSAGVTVRYCAEPFDNDGALASVLVKSLKRAMAAEYSRELSDKITLSKRGLSLQGYWPGGNPPLGLRRGVVMEGHARGASLGVGERNAIKGNRIIVTPGPAEEVALIRRIFRLFTTSRTTPNALARRLNAETGLSCRGKAWTQVRVRKVLGNELYVGTRVVGRAKVRLGTVERLPETLWVRVPGASEPIVSRRVFLEAQRRLERRRSYTDAQMLDALRALAAEKGRLSHNVIARDPRCASPSTYSKRFGSLTTAYALVGYTPSDEQIRLANQLVLKRGRGLHARLSPMTDEQVIANLQALRVSAGMLSIELIEVAVDLPRIRNLLRRFGSMARIYELGGHRPTPMQQVALDRAQRRREGLSGAARPLAFQ